MSGLIDNSKTRLYFSKRGVPLLYVDGLLDTCIVTVENHPKGDIAIIHPDGKVREVFHGEMIKATDNFGRLWVADGEYHPHLLYTLAEQIDATVDNAAILAVTARWIEAFPDKKFSQADFANPNE